MAIGNVGFTNSQDPLVKNLIQDPMMHYKLSVGELGPDNPAPASESIGRVTIHELMNYLSMKRRAIENCEDVVFHSIDLHFVKAGSFIAAESGKTTVYTEKSPQCQRKIEQLQRQRELNLRGTENNEDQDEKLAKTNKKGKKDKKVRSAINTIQNMIEFYKSKLRSDPQNPYYKYKIQQLKTKLSNLKMTEMQSKITNISSKLSKQSEDFLSSLVNGEILDATA